MKWNWQHADWPRFDWDAAALAALEARFLRNAGEQLGSIKHVGDEDRKAILIDMMTGEALKTSEIEGELLNRESVQSSLRRQFGMETDHRRVPPAEAGIAEMMVDLYRDFAEPLAHETLHRWHRMIVNGRHDLKRVGAYRTHETPMQVVSGYLHKPKVHFEAPPSSDVDREMDAFVAWFASSAPDGARPMPALTRAGLAHLYFVSIHPYEDGNGRIARALAEKALAQAVGQPSLLALSHTIQRRRADYYDALERNNKGPAVGDWLGYFAETALEAQAYTQRLIDFLIAKTKLYDRVRDQLNERQARAVARMFREGLDGFKGGLSAANYITITKASRATATRDLADLVSKGVLVSSGTLRHTRYALNLSDTLFGADGGTA
ncbi:Fic family protein [Sphingomonas sp. LB-2]|uniref:Fic family protein n=1 Tax=Sphingomonas caeni TaxID=2984949 RepID=UPI002231D7C1|nr:Fic family protein [Sphingomonas caeni]MCW3847367.1 Fic family protein [Sphingomonas caeni]